MTKASYFGSGVYWFIYVSRNHNSTFMRLLHLFSGYNTLTDCAMLYGIEVISVDIKNYKNSTPQSFLVDFMDFDYMRFTPGYFDFIFVGFPCNTFSKASGGYHFKKKCIPITSAAHKSILMIERLKLVLDYFSSSKFIIENPTSALFSNCYFKAIFSSSQLHFYRFHQKNYGHKLMKQTDFCSNINSIWLDNPVHRVNSNYSKYKIDNLSYKDRVSYPIALCHKIIDFLISNK